MSGVITLYYTSECTGVGRVRDLINYQHIAITSFLLPDKKN